MVLEASGGFAGGQIPETESLVPGTGQGVVTIAAQNHVADEVRVAIQTFLRYAVLCLVTCQLPHNQGLVWNKKYGYYITILYLFNKREKQYKKMDAKSSRLNRIRKSVYNLDVVHFCFYFFKTHLWMKTRSCQGIWDWWQFGWPSHCAPKGCLSTAKFQTWLIRTWKRSVHVKFHDEKESGND